MESIRNYVITKAELRKSTGDFQLTKRNNSLEKFWTNTLNNKLLLINNKIREYFYFKISLSFLKNFNSSIKSNSKITTERIYEISRKVEGNILNESKSSFEYKRLAAIIISDIEKCTLDRKLWSDLRVKINMKPRGTYTQNMKNLASIQLTGVLTLPKCECTKKNIKIKSIQTIKIDLLKLPYKPPKRSHARIKIDSDTSTIKNISCANNAINNGKKEVNEKNLYKTEKKDIISISESNVTTVIDLINKSEDQRRKLQSHEILRKRNVLDSKIDRITFNFLKPVMKEYYLSAYIPNDVYYKYIFQTIHSDILSKRIYDEDAIRKYAVQEIESRKYLSNSNHCFMQKTKRFKVN